MNKLGRAVTEWTKACDRRLARLISYIRHTCEYRQYCYVGNTTQQCRIGLFQDSYFAGDLDDSKSTSGGLLCIFGSQSFVPVSWMCKKQTLVSHNSTEVELISLDAGLRTDGTPALDLWDLVIDIVHSSPNQSEKNKDQVRGNSLRDTTSTKHNNLELSNVDYVSSNAKSSLFVYIFEHSEAVIKMIIKGRSPTMRHVSRTHRVALDWLFDRINLDPKIQIGYIDTKRQLTDSLAEGNFTRDEWNNLLQLFNISHFSSTCCAKNSSLMSCSKRMQEKQTRKKCGKIEIYSDELVFSCSDKFFIPRKSDCILRTGETHSSGENWQAGREEIRDLTKRRVLK